MPACRFPTPWSAELTPNCWIVRDGNGQQLAYVYFEDEPGRRSAAKPTTPLLVGFRRQITNNYSRREHDEPRNQMISGKVRAKIGHMLDDKRQAEKHY